MKTSQLAGHLYCSLNKSIECDCMNRQRCSTRDISRENVWCHADEKHATTDVVTIIRPYPFSYIIWEPAHTVCYGILQQIKKQKWRFHLRLNTSSSPFRCVHDFYTRQLWSIQQAYPTLCLVKIKTLLSEEWFVWSLIQCSDDAPDVVEHLQFVQFSSVQERTQTSS